MSLLFSCIESCYDVITLAKVAIENNPDMLVRLTMKDCIENNKKDIRFYQDLLDKYYVEENGSEAPN